MNSWATVWGIILVGALITFTGVALVVTIGGFADIRAMLRRLDERHGSGSDRET